LFTAVSVVLVATINSNSKPDKAKTEHVKWGPHDQERLRTIDTKIPIKAQ
jgi:hypothetical protein